MFAFACGSSSVASVATVGRGVRWAALGLLLAAAAARFGVRRFVPAIGPAAAASALVALALVSSAWSVSPRLSFERAVSLGILFVAALLLAGSEPSPRGLLTGLVAGAAAVGVAGLVLLVADHSAAVQASSIESPARFRGFGLDANTDALLFAIALAPALSLAADARGLRVRLGAWSAVVLLAGSIVASGSRGALFAGGAGVLVAVAARSVSLRRAALTGAAVVAAVVAGLLIQNIPKARASGSAAPPATTSPGPASRPGYLNAEAAYPLDADVGAPLPGGGQPPVKRGFLGGSGRLDAWTGTLHQILQRPLLGFGFGTEAKVFVDRYYLFVGGLPENSYLGIALQLGAVGLLTLLVLVGSLLSGIRSALAGRWRAVAAACLGAVTAGLALAVVQSYVYSVGDVGTATFWICGFLLPALATEARRG